MAKLQVDYSALQDAGQVRLAELGQAMLDQEAEGLPTSELEQATADLLFGLEALATEPSPAKREVLGGYLNETYGLLAVGTDPFLRTKLPAIPATPSKVVYTVLGLNGRLMVLNANKVVAVKASLSTDLL